VLVTLIGDVSSDYIEIRTLQAQIAIARENVVKQKEALEIARKRFNGGATSELDVFQAENVLGQTEAVIPQLVAQLQQTENALAVLIGVPPAWIDGLLRRSKGIPPPPREIGTGFPADLLRRRPDVRAAELKAEAQSAKVGMAAADLYPAFALGGAFGTLVSTTNGNTINQLFSWPSITYAFGPSFSWPVLNYGQITNQVRAQDAELQALLLNYKNVVLKAQRDVENGLAGFVQGRRQVADLKQSATAASNALTVAISEYQLGSRDFTTRRSCVRLRRAGRALSRPLCQHRLTFFSHSNRSRRARVSAQVRVTLDRAPVTSVSPPPAAPATRLPAGGGLSAPAPDHNCRSARIYPGHAPQTDRTSRSRAACRGHARL
jgi:outer membrane protein TolC